MKKNRVFFKVLVVFLIILVFLLVYCFNNIYSQDLNRPNNLSTMDLLLSENYGYDYFGRTLYEERVSRYDQSKIYFFEALRQYERSNFIDAISQLEEAIQLCPQGIYYYHYGVCLMDVQNYQNSRKAFLKALQFFGYWDPFYEAFQSGRNPFYTFDNNGAPREKYFTYYNLACVHSIENNLNTSFDYLKEALEYGYPYINHLYNDEDLENLLDSSQDIKNQIQTIYNNGFVNNFSGKSYYYGRASNIDDYYFVDNTNIFVESNRDFDHIRFGNYEIRNYQIIMRYNRETGKRGEKPIPGGGVMGAYERYIPYENLINELEIINIKEALKIWEERPYNP
ncbi:hypothetical protein AGMMS49579_11070 [Spirochaetia bacterium]|nr:hypothetical protein AGMMS49579_11070 [Spirochaetia bacterium]